MGQTAKTTHLLSFDVEEYFHVHAAGLDIDETPQFPNRLEPCVDRILERLAYHQASATFFVLGRVARTQPKLVRRIADAGHEIASHSLNHTMLTRLTPERLRDDLLAGRKLIRDLTGQTVLGYRAPTFSITTQTTWALDVLAELGFRYDSSVFPIRHDRYGIPDAPPHPHWATGPGGKTILEIPPMTVRMMGTNWPVGGGGYLRVIPARVLAALVKNADRRRQICMIYLHPWELDPDQPALPMSSLSRWRHHVGLARTQNKLDMLLANFKFASVLKLWPTLNETVHENHTYHR